jgi:hypothetical protein
MRTGAAAAMAASVPAARYGRQGIATSWFMSRRCRMRAISGSWLGGHFALLAQARYEARDVHGDSEATQAAHCSPAQDEHSAGICPARFSSRWALGVISRPWATRSWGTRRRWLSPRAMHQEDAGTGTAKSSQPGPVTPGPGCARSIRNLPRQLPPAGAAHRSAECAWRAVSAGGSAPAPVPARP